MKTPKAITAWAFMAEDNDRIPYFIGRSEPQEIFLTKPKPAPHPFDYFNQGMKWHPTKLLITPHY